MDVMIKSDENFTNEPVLEDLKRKKTNRKNKMNESSQMLLPLNEASINEDN